VIKLREAKRPETNPGRKDARTIYVNEENKMREEKCDEKEPIETGKKEGGLRGRSTKKKDGGGGGGEPRTDPVRGDRLQGTGQMRKPKRFESLGTYI